MGARELLAELAGEGFEVAADAGRLVVRPASRLTEPMRQAIRAEKAALLALVQAPARRAEPECALPFIARRDRLLRWGWSELEAVAMAERLAWRDLQTDARVSCAECRHYRPGRCGAARRAGLLSGEVGRDWAALLQHCAGFEACATD